MAVYVLKGGAKWEIIPSHDRGAHAILFFTGHSEHTIDAKERLAIPAKYRNQWNPEVDGGAWYCLPWPDGHLRLYTEARFRKFADEGDNSLTPSSAEAQLEAQLFSLAERIEMDAAGRIKVPRSHLELAGVGKEVVVIGARVRLEVHNREAWQEAMKRSFGSMQELIDKVNAEKAKAL